MSVTKIPTDIVISDMERQCLMTYDERQKRQFLANKAYALGYYGVTLVSRAANVCIDTIYRGIHELKSKDNETFPAGRIRAAGGGRKPILVKHAEFLSVFDEITKDYTAGLPQNPDVIWLTISTTQIVNLFKERGITVSHYLVRQMKNIRGFKERPFVKALIPRRRKCSATSSAPAKYPPKEELQRRNSKELRPRFQGFLQWYDCTSWHL